MKSRFSPQSPVDSTQATQRTELWWLQRHTQKLTEIKALEYPVDVVFLGDSITHAWEVEGAHAASLYFKHLNVVNLGFAGDCTEHVLWRISNGELDDLHTKYLVLLIGTNNAGHRHDTAQDIADGINAILDVIKRKLPDTTIILMALFPRSRGPQKKMRKIVDACNQIIKDFANQQGVIWLDINHHFLDHNGVLDESVMPDLLHPNDKQYEVWAKELVGIVVGD